MTTTTPSEVRQSNATGARRRQLRLLQLIFAGAAALAMLALFDAARPDTTGSVLDSASVRLTDLAVPASGPSGLQFPQAPPSVAGGFAADDSNDQAQQQEQQAMETIQQAEQQAEQQNEAAQQQALQDELQAQQTEQQANQ